MATIYGVDINEITIDQLIRPEHVYTIYGVLAGDNRFSDPTHKIDFEGSFLVGSENELAAGADYGFAFGTNNRVGARNSFVVGKDGESYAEDQFVLSGGMINQRGDSQRVQTTIPFVSSAGSDRDVVIPTHENTITNFKIRVSAGVDSSFNNDDLASAEYNLVFINSRNDPDSDDRTGKILFLNRPWYYGSKLDDDANGFDVRFEVNDDNELTFRVIDNRSSGGDTKWTLHIDGVETYSGDDITEFGPYGYGYVLIQDSVGGYGASVQYGDNIAGCFFPDTQVILENGNLVDIADIEIGDKLLSAKIDDKEGAESIYDQIESSSTEVTDKYFHFVDGYVNINDELRVSFDQPIMIFDGDIYKFINAKNLTSDMFVVDRNLNHVEVESIEMFEKEVEVVNIDVEPDDVFFANDILVHNKN